jgi:hypothetical protein
MGFKVWAQKNLHIFYLAYFLVLGTALVTEIEYPGNQVSPSLTLTILILHFILGFVEASDQTSVANLVKRYSACGRLWWRSVLAIVTDSLLLVALVLGSMWMYAINHDLETRGLAIRSIVFATVGNTGCVVLRFTSKYTLLENAE